MKNSEEIKALIRELHKTTGKMGGLTNQIKQKETKLMEEAERLELMKDEVSRLRWRAKEIRQKLQDLDPDWMDYLKQ